MAFSINDLNYEKDSKERMPWEHYTEEFAEGRPGRDCRDGFHFLMMKRQKELTLKFLGSGLSYFLAGFSGNS